MLDPDVDLFHARPADPHWNESGWFSFHVPERNAAGALWVHHRANCGYSWAGIVMWDEFGDNETNCLWHDFTISPMDSSAQEPKVSQAFDFTVDSGLRFETVKPLEVYRFHYERDVVTAELEFESFMSPHNSGIAEGWQSWGHGHYEQGGRMRGLVTIGDERFPVDCLSLRDRSWGPFNLKAMAPPHSGFEWALASEELGFLAQSVSLLPQHDDPVIGTTERIKAGWILLDGKVTAIAEGQRSITERTADGTPTKAVVEARDAEGRELYAVGQTKNAYHSVMLGHDVFWYWCLASWKVNGVSAGGEIQDCFAAVPHRKFKRAQLGRKP